MKQLDWVSDPPERVFKDIRNTRPGVSEEKAVLCKHLNDLCRKVPQRVQNGSIDLTRSWLRAQVACLKVLRDKRSSVIELGYAIRRMRDFEIEEAS